MKRGSIYVSWYYLKKHPLKAAMGGVSLLVLVGGIGYMIGATTANDPASQPVTRSVEASEMAPPEATNPAGIADLEPLETAVTECGITYQIVSRWDEGFVGQVSIANTGADPVEGWQVSWQPAESTSIVTIWNGQEAEGDSITISDVPWNEVIPAGSKTTFGFQAETTNGTSIPSEFLLNGEVCPVVAETNGEPADSSESDQAQAAIATVPPVPSDEDSTPTVTPGPTFARFDEPASCAVAYQLQSQRETDFTTDIVITNPTDSVVEGWRLTWEFAGDQRVTTVWNGEATQNGSSVQITHVAFNKGIPPSESVTLGFTGSYDGQNPAPESISLNGVACEVTITDQRSAEPTQ